MPGKDSSHPLGMTLPVISNECERSFSNPIFEGDAKSTKLKLLSSKNLRVLRAFVVKYGSFLIAAPRHQSFCEIDPS